jgi:hypothetical protein
MSTNTNEYNKNYYAKNGATIRANRRRHMASTRAKLKAIVDAFKSEHGCIDCGENDWVVLDMDHRDRLQKRAHISSLVTGRVSEATLRAELEKCDVRCANCHRRKTHRLREFLRVNSAPNLPDTPR